MQHLPSLAWHVPNWLLPDFNLSLFVYSFYGLGFLSKNILQETLRVKDEELQNLARDLRARDSTIRDIADKLSETAEAAETAASAAHIMDEQRRIACSEIERLSIASEKQLESSMLKVPVISPFLMVHCVVQWLYVNYT